MKSKTEIRTKGDITVSRKYCEYTEANLFTIKDLETETQIRIYPNEARFILEVLTEFLVEKAPKSGANNR